MPKAIFVTSWANGAPSLPPMQDDGNGGIYLAHAEGDGYSVLSGLHDPTCIVMVRATDEVLDAIAVSGEAVLLEDIVETTEGAVT